MLKTIVLAALVAFLSAPLSGDGKNLVAVGEPVWMHTAGCSFTEKSNLGDELLAMQCALEFDLKARLRKGPINLGPAPN